MGNAYELIADISRGHGWSTSYQDDQHDRASLNGYTGAFLWAVRELGTHLLKARPDDEIQTRTGVVSSWMDIASQDVGSLFGHKVEVYYCGGRCSIRSVDPTEVASLVRSLGWTD